ncbi:hypothetical protein DY467_25740 [Rhodopseudomonas sp. BR0G17]|nr:hypothetical protein [Rhodopseudomonas sp. BR0G17]
MGVELGSWTSFGKKVAGIAVRYLDINGLDFDPACLAGLEDQADIIDRPKFKGGGEIAKEREHR